ncbi:MAG: class I SAM-dependent methyltransferase [Solirubrobacteraceae bacterium]
MPERRTTGQAVAALEEEVARLRGQLSGQQDVALVLRGQLDEVLGELEETRANVRGMHGWLTRVDGEVGGMRDWLQVTSERTDHLAGRVSNVDPLDGSEHFTLESFEVGIAGNVRGYRDQGHAAGSEVYVGFEDFFRGSEEQIRDRQRPYVALLKDRAPVLDVGCGRGEMLELLGEAGIEAEGVDLDEAMIERCHAKGLTAVTVEDAVGRLQRADDASLGAVFAAQVIEHLPFEALVAFFRHARRALRPGGAVLVETVNPHAPQALKHFWIDPTHQHPLFPEVVLALCRLSGFEQAFLWYPHGNGDPDLDRGEQMDYAVVAETRPQQRSS